MIPLVDIHCHLLAGLDDGPRTEDEALEMCRIAYEDGTRVLAAGAHQNDDYPANTPAVVRAAAERLAQRLRETGLALSIFPSAEIRVFPDMDVAWERAELMSVADRRQCLLIEMPHSTFVDVRGIAERFRGRNLQLILAHPERNPELLHSEGAIEDVIAAGCLVQVSAASITKPKDRRDEKALKDWLQRNLVHFLGSDGHSPRKRAPKMNDAYRQIVNWAGVAIADRIASTSGLAVAQGLPLRITPPTPRKRARWFSRFL